MKANVTHTNLYLTVVRHDRKLYFSATQNGAILEYCTFSTAQEVVDYLVFNWPAGTRVKWMVKP